MFHRSVAKHLQYVLTSESSENKLLLINILWKRLENKDRINSYNKLRTIGDIRTLGTRCLLANLYIL